MTVLRIRVRDNLPRMPALPHAYNDLADDFDRRPEDAMGQVLLADDDAELLRSYERVLRRAGLEVVPVNGGQGALAALKEGSFDAIVSDISMPGMSGIELLRAVREHDLDVPVILM